MSRLLEVARRLWAGADGATMAEYVLMASLIALACLTAVRSLGAALIPLYQSVVNGLS